MKLKAPKLTMKETPDDKLDVYLKYDIGEKHPLTIHLLVPKMVDGRPRTIAEVENWMLQETLDALGVRLNLVGEQCPDMLDYAARRT
jgi:hypothetical protein